MPGTLYLIPNTLGLDEALQDDLIMHVLPTQVQKTAACLEYFIAENAKSARAFLKLLSKATPLTRALQEIRINELNIRTDLEELPRLLAPLRGGFDAGLISEAGVPAVADPGANLVRLAHQEGIKVKPLVGPSSLLLAVMASGLNGQSFAFHGYLPTDAIERAQRLKYLEDRSQKENQTQLFIETPYRNNALIEAIAATCRSNTLVCAATDLTLSSETIVTKTAGHWKADLSAGKNPPLNKRPTVFLLLAE